VSHASGHAEGGGVPVTLLKQCALSNNGPRPAALEGAEFALYRNTRLSGAPGYEPDGPGEGVIVINGVQFFRIAHGTSDVNGRIAFHDISALSTHPDYFYALVETAAPGGYKLAAKPFVFSFFDINGNTRLYLEENGYTFFEQIADTITIQNYPLAFTLPETGGEGALLFIITGLLLLSSAGLSTIYRSRPRKM